MKTNRSVHSSGKVRVRMAPSPTGFLHIGTARAALFNYLFARRHGGMFMLRIEDTDAERSKTEYEIQLIEGLHWLGLEWDEGPDYEKDGRGDGARPGGERGGGKLVSRGSFSPYRQSERQGIYKKYVGQLLAEHKAYYCYCTREELEAQQQALLASGLPPRYNGHCRAYENAAPPAGRAPQVVRFKTPEVKVEFKDLIRGKVAFDASLFGDMIVTRADGSVLYNLAVVIDDYLMGITHVIRGDDHLSNTPKQILFQQALGFPEPVYAHIPLILNADRSKMSKRKNKASLLEYREAGYLPEAMVNFLALLGWHPKDDREVLSRDELTSEFDLERVQKSGAVFNQEKLDWLNREHMKKFSNAGLAALAEPFIKKTLREKGIALPPADFIERLVAVERTRANTLGGFAEVGSFFFELPDYKPELLVWKEMPMKETAAILEKVYEELEMHDAAVFHRKTLLAALTSIIEETGGGNRGAVLWPLRVALSGLQSSPDPIEIMEVLGKHESLARIKTAIGKLE